MYKFLSLACLFLTIWIVSIVSIAWVTKKVYQNKSSIPEWQTQTVTAIASFPGRLNLAYLTAKDQVTGVPNRLLVKRKTGRENAKLTLPCNDDGYLLLSGLNPTKGRSTIRFIRLSDGNLVKEWEPDWSDISKQSQKKFGKPIDVGTALPFHPLLVENGGLIFNVQLRCVYLNERSEATLYNFTSHHSVEFLGSAKTIVTPGYSTSNNEFNSYIFKKILDDSIQIANIDGSPLKNLSFAQIIIKNGLNSLMFGHSGGENISDDLLHINQISCAKSDGAVWKKGDLLISCRHLSAVFIYRPDDDQIVWYQIGPWKNQHSADFLDDKRIVILDNNVYGYDDNAPSLQNFLFQDDINRVVVLDFSSRKPLLTEPYKQVLESDEIRPRTITEGRVRILPDQSMFFEDTNNCRCFKVSKDKVIWIFENNFSDKLNARLSWSRYITKSEASILLRHIKDSR